MRERSIISSHFEQSGYIEDIEVNSISPVAQAAEGSKGVLGGLLETGFSLISGITTSSSSAMLYPIFPLLQTNFFYSKEKYAKLSFKFVTVFANSSIEFRSAFTLETILWIINASCPVQTFRSVDCARSLNS